MEKKPLVSVVMPVYNGGLFLKEAIDSILQQTLTDFEFIIINDGSTDNSLEIIDTYKDKRIIVVNQNNKGLAASLNVGIAKCIGKYIARMDADDISIANRLQIQVDFLESHPEISVLSGASSYMDENGAILGRSFPVTMPWVIEKMLMYLGSVICHPAVMIRKIDLNKVGGYSEIIDKRFEDYYLWTCFIRKGYKIKNLSDILIKYRISDIAISSQYSLESNQMRVVSQVMRQEDINQQQVAQLNEYIMNNQKGSYLLNRSKLYRNMQNKLYDKFSFISPWFVVSILTFLVNVYAIFRTLFVELFVK